MKMEPIHATELLHHTVIMKCNKKFDESKVDMVQFGAKFYVDGREIRSPGEPCEAASFGGYLPGNDCIFCPPSNAGVVMGRDAGAWLELRNLNSCHWSWQKRGESISVRFRPATRDRGQVGYPLSSNFTSATPL